MINDLCGEYAIVEKWTIFVWNQYEIVWQINILLLSFEWRIFRTKANCRPFLTPTWITKKKRRNVYQRISRYFAYHIFFNLINSSTSKHHKWNPLKMRFYCERSNLCEFYFRLLLAIFFKLIHITIFDTVDGEIRSGTDERN